MIERHGIDAVPELCRERHDPVSVGARDENDRVRVGVDVEDEKLETCRGEQRVRTQHAEREVRIRVVDRLQVDAARQHGAHATERPREFGGVVLPIELVRQLVLDQPVDESEPRIDGVVFDAPVLRLGGMRRWIP